MNTNQKEDMSVLGSAAKAAWHQLNRVDTAQKNQFLSLLTDQLLADEEAILEANGRDLEAGKAAGMDAVLLDRLSLVERVSGIADDVRTVIGLEDPVGEVLEERKLPNGLQVSRWRTPIGVLGVIYEARPNVTIDVAALAIKSCNSVILRGGKEALHTNVALGRVIDTALRASALPAEAVQIVQDPSREQVAALLRMYDTVDMIIPRGGAGLHQYCLENSLIPVITGGIGVCHLFVDEDVVLEEAIAVVDNAKTQRPTVCNALDTVLLHEKIAERFIAALRKRLEPVGVSFSVDARTADIMVGDHVQEASEEDWHREWLSLTLGVRIVSGLDEALDHIHRYSSGHSDGILTRSKEHADRFVHEVDSAVVYVNASTRFTDGSQLGLGAEVAISTQKLHARGPMGLTALTTYKWVVKGNNHVRA